MTGPVPALSPLAPPLRHGLARLLLGGFLVLHAALAATAGAAGAWPTWAAYALLVVASAWTVLAPDHPLLPWVAAAAAVGACALVVLPLPLAGWPGYAAWPLGAAAFVALALTLRDLARVAWTILLGMVAVGVVWSVVRGGGALPGLDLVVRHAGTLLLGTLFALGLRRAARTVAALQGVERQRLLEAAMVQEQGGERRRAALHVLSLAAGPLERLAAGRGGEPAALLALEGRLRDEITAGPLLTERLNDAVAAARRRGVDVVLLSDGVDAPLPDPLRHTVADWLTDRVVAAAPGELTGRILHRGGVLRVSASDAERSDSAEFAAG